ncbi:MAG: hypothetical protein HYZ73_03140 [Elusimicrobia bacterium]|nr:hypothetical protein [Elusimicrobiota bacterium]
MAKNRQKLPESMILIQRPRRWIALITTIAFLWTQILPTASWAELPSLPFLDKEDRADSVPLTQVLAGQQSQQQELIQRALVANALARSAPFSITSGQISQIKLQDGSTWTLDTTSPLETTLDNSQFHLIYDSLGSLKGGFDKQTQRDFEYKNGIFSTIHTFDTPVYRSYNASNGDHKYKTTQDLDPGYVLELNGAPIAYVSSSPGTDLSPFYNVENPHTGENYYTLLEGEKNALVTAGWQDKGSVGYLVNTPPDIAPLYRLYNPNPGGMHFFTTSRAERDELMAKGWRSEGMGEASEAAGYLALTPSTTFNIPVYRSYNASNGDHQYGTTQDLDPGYVLELGGEPIAYVSSSPGTDLSPFYNVENPYTGENYYTLSEGEKNALVAAGWQDKNFVGYLLNRPPEISPLASLYRLYNSSPGGMHFFTTNRTERDELVKLGWKSQGMGDGGAAGYLTLNTASVSRVEHDQQKFSSIPKELDSMVPALLIQSAIPTLTNQKSLKVDYTSDGVAKSKTFTLQEGDNTGLFLSETNLAGNTITLTLSKVILDSVTPVVALTSPILTRQADYTLSYSIDGGTQSEAVTLTEGANTLARSFSDTAGNKTDVSWTITLDSIAPVLTLTSPTLTRQADYTLSYSVDGVTQTEAVTLTEGANTLARSFSDAAGNSSTATWSVTLDTVAPVITLGSAASTNQEQYQARILVNGQSLPTETWRLGHGVSNHHLQRGRRRPDNVSGKRGRSGCRQQHHRSRGPRCRRKRSHAHPDPAQDGYRSGTHSGNGSIAQ